MCIIYIIYTFTYIYIYIHTCLCIYIYIYICKLHPKRKQEKATKWSYAFVTHDIVSSGRR